MGENSVRNVLAAVLVLMLSFVAMAATEPPQQVGPYTISFDMNTDMQKQIKVNEPMMTSVSEINSMSIVTDNNTGAGIAIADYKDLADATISTGKQIAAMNMMLQGLNVTKVEDKNIDGNNGFVLTGTPMTSSGAAPSDFKVYRAVYWLDSKECGCGDLAAGNTNVVITSTYPEDVTMSLLDSIKIEKTA